MCNGTRAAFPVSFLGRLSKNVGQSGGIVPQYRCLKSGEYSAQADLPKRNMWKGYLPSRGTW